MALNLSEQEELELLELEKEKALSQKSDEVSQPENAIPMEKEKSIPEKIKNFISGVYSDLPGRPLTRSEFENATAGMTKPEQLKYAAKKTAISAAKMAPFFIAPELGAIKAGLVTGGSSLAESALKGDDYTDAAKKAALSGLLGGTLQKGMQLIGKAGAPATGFALGVKTPIAKKVIEKPELLEEGGETGFSGFAKDYAKTLKGLETEAGKSTAAIKESISPETSIDISDTVSDITNKYSGKVNLKGIGSDLVSFAKNQHSTISPKSIKKLFDTNSLKTMSYEEAQNLRDLLGDFTKYGEKAGKPQEIAEQLRRSLGSRIDAVDERFMPAQETYAKTRELVERARKSAGIPEEAIKFAEKEGRSGVFELPPDFSESGFRTLGSELLLASGKKEPQANILKLVEERSRTPLQERLKDITTRIAVQEAKERPLGLLSAAGVGSSAGMMAANPLVSTGILAPIIARTTFQKNPQALAALIRGIKKIAPTVRQGSRVAQGLTQNIMRGEQ